MSRKDAAPPWSHELRLTEVVRHDRPLRLEADEAARKRIARELDLVDLPEFSGDVRLSPWLDGVQIDGRWTARVVYRCGITLDPYEEPLSGEFTVRAVPAGSPAAEEPESGPDAELSLESEDPPDVLADDRFDVAGYLVEHLALELDPFPRKPGAQFEPPAPSQEESPFAVLRGLKPANDESDG